MHRRLIRNTPAPRLAAKATGTKGVLNLRQLSQRKGTSIQRKAIICTGPDSSRSCQINCQFGAAHLQTKDVTSDKMGADPYGAASRISRCSPWSNQKAPNS